MKNSPWAKLTRRTTPNIRARPVATMAYMDPSVRPWIVCSRRSSIPKTRTRRRERSGLPPRASGRWRGLPENRRARRELLDDPELDASHLDEDHVDPGLVILVELDRADRRVLHIDLLEGVPDRRPIRSAGLLDRELERRGDGVLERQCRHAAVDPHGRLPPLEPLPLPVGVERRRPERGLDDAVADRRVVLDLVQELDGRDAAASINLLREPEFAKLPHEDTGVAGQHDEQDRVRGGALDPRQQRPVVGLAAVEELR